MAQYQKSLDIWKLDTTQKKALQAGQWVTAGTKGCVWSRGIWCGVSAGGSDVCLWLGNMRGLKGAARLERIRFMMQYAK